MNGKDIARQDLLKPGSALSASCCKMCSRNLQSDWSSGFIIAPGNKDLQGHLSHLAQIFRVWSSTASLCIWTHTHSGLCRCINTVSKAIPAIWRSLFPHRGSRDTQVSDLVTGLWHIIHGTTLIQSIWKSHTEDKQELCCYSWYSQSNI